MTKSKAPAHIKNASTKKLLELWDLTENMKHSQELAIVRGWLMDELEARDPEGFDRWIDSEDPNADPKDFIKH